MDLENKGQPIAQGQPIPQSQAQDFNRQQLNSLQGVPNPFFANQQQLLSQPQAAPSPQGFLHQG